MKIYAKIIRQAGKCEEYYVVEYPDGEMHYYREMGDAIAHFDRACAAIYGR